MDSSLCMTDKKPHFSVFLILVVYDGNYQSIINIQPESPGSSSYSLSVIYFKNIFVYEVSGYWTQEIKAALETFGYKLVPFHKLCLKMDVNYLMDCRKKQGAALRSSLMIQEWKIKVLNSMLFIDYLFAFFFLRNRLTFLLQWKTADLLLFASLWMIFFSCFNVLI